MKNSHPLLFGGITLCICLFLFSCKKDLDEDIALQSNSALQSANANDCRPAVFGVYFANSPGHGNEWITLAQKWYANGKVKYLKAKSTRYTSTFFDPYLELMYDLQWGEVRYQGNQVYLKDVLNDHTLMRVTLDDHGRPAASYWYNEQVGTQTYWYDTTYYYYNGDRLDYMISLFETNGWGTPIHSWRKNIFSYDQWGNLIKAGSTQNPDFNIQYDYSKPVRGIVLNYQLTSSLSLLEYMELITLPMHHAVTKINYSGGFGYATEYKDYEITDGLVRSYVLSESFPYSQGKTTFYNGWDCGIINSNSNGNAIATMEQFQQLYPKVGPH